ncbi:MAG: hypothetical protein J6Y75_05155 [Spirochaetaceae bacterium]|nr:hypothetical protein [Spirochaetaceae bacterium]
MKRIVIIIFFLIECSFIFPCGQETNKYKLFCGMEMNDIYNLLGEPNEFFLFKDSINDTWDLYRAVFDDLIIHYYPFGNNTIYEVYIFNAKYILEINNIEIVVGENKNQIEEKLGIGNFRYKDKYNKYVFRYNISIDFPEDPFLECYYDYNFNLVGFFVGSYYNSYNWARYD